MSPKAPYNWGGKRAAAETEAKLAELGELAEARGNAVAGSQPAALEAVPLELAPLEAEGDAASSQARKPATSRARKAAAPSSSRSGTQAAPHVRVDGQATRSTTVHLPVDLHQKLRLEAARRGGHMSAIVAEAVRDWFSKR